MLRNCNNKYHREGGGKSRGEEGRGERELGWGREEKDSENVTRYGKTDHSRFFCQIRIRGIDQRRIYHRVQWWKNQFQKRLWTWVMPVKNIHWSPVCEKQFFEICCVSSARTFNVSVRYTCTTLAVDRLNEFCLEKKELLPSAKKSHQRTIWMYAYNNVCLARGG